MSPPQLSLFAGEARVAGAESAKLQSQCSAEDSNVEDSAPATPAPSHPLRPPHRPHRPRPAHPLRLCVLGSGSGGNSTVVLTPEGALLIDAGFGPRTTALRLAQARLSLDEVRAVLLTHLDRDHFRPHWIRQMLRRRVTLHLHAWHLPDLLRLRGARAMLDEGLIATFDDAPFTPIAGGSLTARGVRLQHDRQGTIGYRIDLLRQVGDGGPPLCHGSIGYATDLGHAPASLIRHLAGVDLLCLEANYDQHMTITSSRPSFVNRRNLSDSGHLSNEQALDAVQRIAAVSPHGNPRRVVLMHRSSQCNHPMKVRRVFERCPMMRRRVVLAEQRRRTRWFDVRPLRLRMHREQMTLGLGGSGS